MNNCYKNNIGLIILILVLILIIIVCAITINKDIIGNSILIFFLGIFVIGFGIVVINDIKDCNKQKKQDEKDVIDAIENMTIPNTISELDIESINKFQISQIKYITNNNINKLHALQKYFYDLKNKAASDKATSKKYLEYDPFIKEVNSLIAKYNLNHELL